MRYDTILIDDLLIVSQIIQDDLGLNLDPR